MKETVCLIAAVRYFLYLQACGRTDRFVLLGLAMLLLMCFVVCFCSSTQTYIITNLKSAAFKNISQSGRKWEYYTFLSHLLGSCYLGFSFTLLSQEWVSEHPFHLKHILLFLLSCRGHHLTLWQS